jgi:hypothetical protein
MTFDDPQTLELLDAIASLEGEPGDEDEMLDFDSWDEMAETDDLDELYDEDFDEFESDADLEMALRGALLVEYANASPGEMSEALINVMESLAPAEAFNFGKALSQIEKGASRALEDPTVRQIAGTALPIVGGAAGTFIGGPAGTAVGAQLGTAAAKALPSSTKSSQPTLTTTASSPVNANPIPAVPSAGGSDAALKGLVLSELPAVKEHLLALALGEHGRRAVGGVPVGAVMNLLSTTFGQAAADADELISEAEDAHLSVLNEGGQIPTDPASPASRAQALYARLLEAEAQRLALARGWR